MENEKRFRFYLYSIVDAFLENDMPRLHLMAREAFLDYAKDNITYKQLYVINSLGEIFTSASMNEE